MNDIKTLLVGIAGLLGVLCIFAAMIIFARSKLGGESQGGGMAEQGLIGCVLGAAAAFAAAAFIQAQNFQIF